MKMLNYEFVEVIIPQLISERPNYGVESITREQFLFYEMSNIVLLTREGLSDGYMKACRYRSSLGDLCRLGTDSEFLNLYTTKNRKATHL